MSEKELTQGPLGTVGKYDVKIVDGKLRVEVSYESGGVAGGLFINVEAKELLDMAIDKVEAMIPGDQTGMASLLKGALGSALG